MTSNPLQITQLLGVFLSPNINQLRSMACSLNMQIKNEPQPASPFMNPRISFSNDFIDPNHHETINTYNEAPVSSDFEFSVPTFSSNSADEVFFKGKLLPPLKEKVVTLRDELLLSSDDGDDDDVLYDNKKLRGWWREKFGLRMKSQNGKSDQHKNLGGLETINEAKIKPTFYTPNFTGSNRYK